MVAEGADLAVRMAKLLELASRGNDVIKGKAFGPKPKYFILGDEPTMRDIVVGMPFCGSLNEVLTKAMESLAMKYGATPEECYATYLVKTRFTNGELTEDMIVKEWLPVARLEYYLSGCEMLVAVGRVAKLFAGHVTTKPDMVKPYELSLKDKVKAAWQLLRA